MSYFEFSTLAALVIFQEAELDYVLLEVGLGGRLDAVNIVDPNIAIITSIDFDHMHFLGNTREAIATEKAGIMRPNVPVICSDTHPPLTIALKANETGAILYQIGEDFSYHTSGQSWTWSNNAMHFTDLPLSNFILSNMSAAIQALVLLDVDGINRQDEWQSALLELKLSGRRQHIHGKPEYLLDVAHNPQSARALSEYLAGIRKQYRKVYALFSALADKTIDEIVAPMSDLVDEWWLIELDEPRGAKFSQLHEAINTSKGAIYRDFSTIEAIIEHSKVVTAQDDLILVFGSFYTVAQAMQFVV